MWAAGVGVAILLLGLGRARADPAGRPPVRLELAACLADAGAIARAVRVELGDDALTFAVDASLVRVDCATDGVDAGIVVEVRPADSPRRYRYALDWRAQPVDARPRLVGLAIAEAIDASRIELTAVPEPVVTGPAAAPAVAPPRPRDWTIGLVGSHRAFSAPAGVNLLGAGLAASVRLSHHWRIAADVLAEGANVLSPSGAVSVLVVSSAPRLVVHAGDQTYAELGAGARVGAAFLTGQAIIGSQLTAYAFSGPWLGPAASLALGAALTPTISVRVSFEVGVALTGTKERDLGSPAAAVDGTWTAFAAAAEFAL